MAKKSKVFEYPASVRLMKEGTVLMVVMTQLYKIGIYVIVDNDSGMQSCTSLPQITKYMKQFEESNLKEGITVEFGSIIHAFVNEEGFCEQIRE